MAEWEGCEKPIVEALVERGWEYVPGRELPRGTEDVLIVPHLREFVEREAEKMGIEMKEEHFSQIMLTLQGRAGIEGAKEILQILKDGFVPVDIKGRGLSYVKIIDYEDVSNNKLVVSNQVTFLTPTSEEKRLDVVLFVNGIPIAAIECKNPAGTQNWYDAFLQLRGYEKSLSELFRFVQLNVALGAKARVYPTMPWVEENEKIKPARWRAREDELDEMKGVVELLSPNVLLDVLKNFVFIQEFRGEIKKLMPRYMQYRAVNEICRVVGEKNGGVIWHWQGSGKTYTMIFAAYKLYTMQVMEKPTIFFVMDRRELQEQFFEFLRGMDFGGKVLMEKVESVEHLDRILRFDGGRGKRGFFVLLIHKFKERGGIELEEIERMEVVNRSNIFVFVDETHRTQYGVMAARMKRALRNAKFFAFTGTPLLRSDKNTFREFGTILDRYFIEQSVRDGYTVPMVYTFAKERGVHLKTEELRRAVKELIPAEEEEEVARRLHPTKEFMKGEKRMRKIARSVVEDLLNNRTYKGMLVAVDREACVLYRRYIMEYIREKYPRIYEKYGERFAEIVMTYNPGKDMEVIEEYRKEVERRYGISWDEVNKKLREDFRREEELPRLIIVTDMLLTGYDVPVLEVMYLDKIMTGHGLLQAMARTNRPYKDKGFGVIVDYVGIFKIFRETLQRYYSIEETDVENAAISVEILVDMLTKKMEEMCSKIPQLCERMDALASTERDALYEVLYEIYRNGKERELENGYREISGIWRALGGNPVKAERRNLNFYRALLALYVLHRRLHGKPVPAEVMETVEKIGEKIRTMSAIRDLRRGQEIVIDELFLEDLIAHGKNVKSVVDMTAVLNLFVASVRGNAVHEKIFGDIVEYIENAIHRWKERKSTMEELYLEEKRMLEKILKERKRMEAFRLSPAEYAIIKVVQKEMDYGDILEVVMKMIESLRKEGLIFEGWHRKADVVKKVREEVRKAMLHYMVLHKAYDGRKLDMLVEEIMKLLPFLEVRR